jgi:hypothetical protein
MKRQTRKFYRTPRLVTHIDEGAIAAVTQLYRSSSRWEERCST